MLKISQVSKSFPQCFAPALKDINFELATGEFCILIGANGSGKSSLLKTISGEYRNDTGSIELDGINLNSKPLHLRAKLITHVTQDLNKGSIAEMTVLENIALSLLRARECRLKSYRHYTQLAYDSLAQLNLGLENYLEAPMRVLSGGQRQMITTLMALLSQPKLLLLDEHTSALDPKTKKLLMQYTADKIAAHKISTLMITHNLEDVVNFGSRVIMLHQGSIVLDLQGPDKARLSAADLLKLFHHYEDLTLTQAGESS